MAIKRSELQELTQAVAEFEWTNYHFRNSKDLAACLLNYTVKLLKKLDVEIEEGQ